MLRVIDLCKSYGDRILFEEVSFSLSAGERLGLVGRNGCGKSTLFKLILDVEHPDDGSIVMPKNYIVGHLEQHLNFKESSILKEACLGLPKDERDQEYRGEIMLAGLGFSQEDMHKPASHFSGGFQIRINLAKLLLSEPNLLLLDEPTNYLDIVSMRWLSSFLSTWQNELIIISHDRSFMDSVTTHTMFIHRGKIRKVQGDTTKLYTQVAQDEEIYEKTRINEDKKRKELEDFINRFRAQASKAALVQSKVKALEKMGKKDELQDIQTLDFQFCQAAFPGKLMLETKGLTFNYPNGPNLIEDLNFSVKKGDRFCIIGKNGKGKSTLLRLLYSELSPSSGEISFSQNAKIGYFGQSNISRLDSSLTVEQEITSANNNLDRTKIRGICGTMMFSGDDALKKIKVLSGGEKSRVLLGKLLASPTNILLLDEPTNHLDMESIEALIESLKNYEGAVFVVTHSELILKEFANRLIVFQEDVPFVFEHNYEYFLEKIGWGDDEGMSSRKEGRKSKKEDFSDSDKKLKQLENKISKMEKEVQKLEDELATASSQGDVQKITNLSFALRDLQDEIKEKYAEWENISAK